MTLIRSVLVDTFAVILLAIFVPSTILLVVSMVIQ
jgi:hypothetical protein